MPPDLSPRRRDLGSQPRRRGDTGWTAATSRMSMSTSSAELLAPSSTPLGHARRYAPRVARSIRGGRIWRRPAPMAGHRAWPVVAVEAGSGFVRRGATGGGGGARVGGGRREGV
ncbi:unnamed protein product [Urochloa humidicola]